MFVLLTLLVISNKVVFLGNNKNIFNMRTRKEIHSAKGMKNASMFEYGQQFAFGMTLLGSHITLFWM